jgi:hypothetical protein
MNRNTPSSTGIIADDITIAVDTHYPARVVVTGATTRYGDFTFSIGGDCSEVVIARGRFSYRNKNYAGSIYLLRSTMTPIPNHSITLLSETDELATEKVFSSIAMEVTAAIMATLRAHPEVITEGQRAYLDNEIVEAEQKQASLLSEALELRNRLVGLRNQRRTLAESVIA